MPPAYVEPYVKRHKNDATDAEAICEAVTRANMRFVATKTPEQQTQRNARWRRTGRHERREERRTDRTERREKRRDHTTPAAE